MNPSDSEALILDFDGWLGRQDSGLRESVNAYLDSTDDRKAAQERFANIWAVADANKADPMEIRDRWDEARNGFARANGWKENQIDDAQFTSFLRNKYQEQKDERQLLYGQDEEQKPKPTGPVPGAWGKRFNELYGGAHPVPKPDLEQIAADAAEKKRLDAWSSSLAGMAQAGAYEGKSLSEVLGEWQTKAAGKPGWNIARTAEYEAVAAREYDAVAKLKAEVEPVANQVYDKLKAFYGNLGETDPMTRTLETAYSIDNEGDALAAISGMTGPQKAMAFRLIADRGAQEGNDNGLIASVVKSLWRSTETFGRRVGSSIELGNINWKRFNEGDQVSENDPLAEIMNQAVPITPSDIVQARTAPKRTLTAEDAANWNAQLDKRAEDIHTREILREVAISQIAPASKPVTFSEHPGTWLWNKTVLPIFDSIPLISSYLLMPTPVAFMLNAQQYNVESYLHFRDQGVDNREAWRLAQPAGFIKSALDLLETETLTRQFPVLRRSLEQAALRGGAWSNLGKNFASTFVPETVIELGQDVWTDALVQDVWGQRPEFDKSWGDVWKETKAQIGDIALGMIGLSAIGATGQSFAQRDFVRTFTQSGASMRNAGYSNAQIAEIQAAPLSQRGTLLAQYLPEKAPQGEERKTQIAEVKVWLEKERAQAQAQAVIETQATGDAAAHAIRITHNGEQWQVQHSDGKVVNASSAEAAIALRNDLRQSYSEAEATALVAEVEDWAKSKPEGQGAEFAIEGTTKVATASESGGFTQQIGPKGEVLSVEEMTPQYAAALYQQGRELGAADAEGVVHVIVNGSNATDFAETVAEDARRLINRITLGQSEDRPLITLAHERVEEAYRKALGKGVISEKGTQQAIASIADAFKIEDARTPEERKFRERIQAAARGEATGDALREIHSELVVANELGRGKDGGKVMRAGTASLALEAAARSANDLEQTKAIGRLRQFIAAIKTRMRALWGTMMALRKLRKEGKAVQWEEHIAKVLGIDEQLASDKAALEEAQAIAEDGGVYTPPSAEAQANGEAFSLSFGDAVTRFQQQIERELAKDPEARMRMAWKAIENFKRLADDWSRVRFTPSGDTIRPVVEKLTSKELDAQQKAREEWLFNEGLNTLTPATAHAYYQGRMKLEEHPFIAEMLSNGRLQSEAETKRKGRRGEYDDKVWIPPQWYGGSITPDEMAQILSDAGLLKDAYPATFWKELGEVIASVRRANEDFKAAVEAVKAVQKQAKEQAQAWRDNYDEFQAKDWGVRSVIKRNLQMYNALVSTLPAEVRGKLTGWLRLATVDVEGGAKVIERNIEKAAGLLEKYLRKQYDGELKKLFKAAEPKQEGSGKKPKGKIGADVHQLFDVLRAAVGWDAAEVEAHGATMDALLASEDLTPEQEAHLTLEKQMVLLFGDWKHADAARRETAIREGRRIYANGYLDAKIKAAAERERIQAARATVKRESGKAGTQPERDARLDEDSKLPGKLSKWRLNLASFEQLLKYVLGEKSLLAQRYADRQRFAEAVAHDEVFTAEDGLKDFLARMTGKKRFAELGAAQLEYDLSQKTIEVQGRKLSELEGVSVLLTWQQEDGKRNMIGHLDENGKPNGEWHMGQEFVDELQGKLSDEAKAIYQWLKADYAAEWGPLNEVFAAENGINLPRNENYAPLSSVPLQAAKSETIDPLTGQAVGTSMTPGSLRTRTHRISEPRFLNALAAWRAHKKEMAHWKANAALVREMQSVFGDRSTGNSVEAAAGGEAIKMLRERINMLATGGIRDASMQLAINQDALKMTGRAATMAIAGNLGVLPLQATQLGAAVSEMPVGSYLKRLAKLFSGQLKWGDAFNSDYMQRRIKELPPAARFSVNALNSGSPTLLRYAAMKLGALVGGFDALFTSGTYAMVYDYQLQQAKELGIANAEEYATQETDRIVDRLAQPTRQGSRSTAEITATNPAWKLFWSFASEGRKNVGLALYALAKKTNADKARTLLYVVVLNSLIGALIRNAYRDLFRDRGDDDEAFDAKIWSKKRLALMVATEPLQAVPFFGGAATAAIYGMLGQYYSGGDLLSAGERGAKAARNIPDILSGKEEASKALADAQSIVSAFGLVSADASAAASLLHVVSDIAGGIDNLITTGEEEIKHRKQAMNRAKREAKQSK